MPRHPPRPVRGPQWITKGTAGTLAQPATGPHGDPVARVVAAWMRRLYDGSPQTARSYRREATNFLEFLAHSYGPGFAGLLHAKPSDCVAFVHAVPDLSPASRAVKVAVIRSLFGALVLEGLRPENPASDIQTRGIQSGKHHHAISQAAMIAVLDHLRASERLPDVRDRALLLLALAVGARRSELASLNVGSLERGADGTAQVVFVGKGGKAARMMIKPGIVAAIDRWLTRAGHGHNPDAPLFQCLSRRPDHVGKRLTGGGIRCIVKAHFPNHSPHGIRGRAITDVWILSGFNIGDAQTFGRHSSPAITEKIYVQAEKLDKAMKYTFDYA